MSRKKSKRNKYHPTTSPNKDGGEKHTGDNMHVSGDVEIRRSPSLQDEHKAERREDTAQENKKYFVEKLMLCAVVIYAGLTLWQAYSTKKAADAAESAAKTSASALVDVQRAFVYMSGVDTQVIHPKANDEGVLFDFRWKNTSTTPAKLFQAHINYQFGAEMDDKFSFADEWNPSFPNAEGFLGPLEETRMPLDRTIPSPIIGQLANHMGHFYVWGWAKYRDIFNDTPQHITRFCTEIVPVDFHREPDGGMKFSAAPAICRHGHYACIDEQCKNPQETN